MHRRKGGDLQVADRSVGYRNTIRGPSEYIEPDSAAIRREQRAGYVHSIRESNDLHNSDPSDRYRETSSAAPNMFSPIPHPFEECNSSGMSIFFEIVVIFKLLINHPPSV